MFICAMICRIVCWVSQTLPESGVTAILPNGVELNDPQEIIFEFTHLVVQSHNLQWMLRRLGDDGKVVCLSFSVSLDAGAIIGIGKPIVICASLAFTEMFAGKLLGGKELWVFEFVFEFEFVSHLGGQTSIPATYSQAHARFTGAHCAGELFSRFPQSANCWRVPVQKF